MRFLGRTDTIKKRTLYIYVPSEKQKEKWEKLAERSGTSLSKFVIESVENSLGERDDVDFKPRQNLIKDLHETKEELKKLRTEKDRLESLLDRQETDLRKYRAMLFLNGEVTGIRQYDKTLVETLRNNKNLTHEEILDTLGIQPNEHEAIRATSDQLNALAGYGLVESTPRGWRWVE